MKISTSLKRIDYWAYFIVSIAIGLHLGPMVPGTIRSPDNFGYILLSTNAAPYALALFYIKQNPKPALFLSLILLIVSTYLFIYPPSIAYIFIPAYHVLLMVLYMVVARLISRQSDKPMI